MKRRNSFSSECRLVKHCAFGSGFLELPVDTFRYIVALLNDPEEKNIRNLFSTSHAIRQKFLEVFMESLWIRLNGQLKLHFAHAIQNLCKPTKAVDLSQFSNLKDLVIDVDSSSRIQMIPAQIVSLKISFSNGLNDDIDLSHLVQLEHLVVGENVGVLKLKTLSIGSKKLRTLDVYRAAIIGELDCKNLRNIRLTFVKVNADITLEHKIEEFLFYHSDFLGSKKLAKGNEVKEIYEFPLQTLRRGYEFLKTGIFNASPGADIDEYEKNCSTEDRETLRWWLQK